MLDVRYAGIRHVDIIADRRMDYAFDAKVRANICGIRTCNMFPGVEQSLLSASRRCGHVDILADRRIDYYSGDNIRPKLRLDLNPTCLDLET